MQNDSGISVGIPAEKIYDGLSEADRNEVQEIATSRLSFSPSTDKTYETRTPAERVEAFLAWTDRHKDDTAP